MTAQRGRTWSAAEKAEYRRFVRENHPDAGGDPAVFAAGMRRFQRDHPPEPVIVVRQRRGLLRLAEVLVARRRRRRRTRVR